MARQLDVRALESRRHAAIIPIVALLALVAVVHGFDLESVWSGDDGTILILASEHAPLHYFFSPVYVHGVSPANFVTPWLVFVYDVNLALFGLTPVAFYAHQILTLAAATILTFILLRLWIGVPFAAAGAALFCVSPPAFYIAKQLMNTHYIYGLLFTIAAAILFVLAARRNQWRYALAGALFYLLAVNCKEIYVPLPLVLPFLPVGDARMRLRFVTPFLAVLLWYVVWRYLSLGALLGGYRENLATDDFRLFGSMILRLPALLFGGGATGIAAAILAATLVIAGIRAGKLHLRLAAVTAVVVLGPLLPLGVLGPIVRPERYLLLVAWTVATSLAVFATAIRWRAIAFLMLAAIGSASLLAGLSERAYLIRGAPSGLSRHYAFLMQSDAPSALLIDRSAPYLNNQLNGMAEAYHLHGSDLKTRIFGFDELRDGVVPEGLALMAWSTACACIAPVSLDEARLRAAAPALDLSRPLAFALQWNARSRLLTWRGGPYEQGVFTIGFEQWPGRYTFKNQAFRSDGGAKIFWPDAAKPFRFFVRYFSTDGWETRSPTLVVRFDETQSVTWHR